MLMKGGLERFLCCKNMLEILAVESVTKNSIKVLN